MVSASLVMALTAGAAVAGVTVIPEGALAASVTVPLNPFTGVSTTVLVPDLAGAIGTSAFCVVSEKSVAATVTFTPFDAAEL